MDRCPALGGEAPLAGQRRPRQQKHRKAGPLMQGRARWPPAEMPSPSGKPCPGGRSASPTGRVQGSRWPCGCVRGLFLPTGQGPRATWCPSPSGQRADRRSGPADLPSYTPLARGAHAATRGLEAEGVSNGTRGLAPPTWCPSLGQGQSCSPLAAPALRGSCPLGVLAGSALVPRAAVSKGPGTVPPAARGRCSGSILITSKLGPHCELISARLRGAQVPPVPHYPCSGPGAIRGAQPGCCAPCEEVAPSGPAPSGPPWLQTELPTTASP